MKVSWKLIENEVLKKKGEMENSYRIDERFLNLVKENTDRAKQNSSARAETNFSQPRAHHFWELRIYTREYPAGSPESPLSHEV